MKWALTGGSGELGRAVLRELLARGHSVRALTRRADAAELPRDPRVAWIAGDLGNPRALDELVSDCDGILHAGYGALDAAPPAGRSIAEHFAETNFVGTTRLIERTPTTRLRQLVFVSSLAVYGTHSHHQPAARRMPLDEDFPVWPREFYGGHKAALERLVIAAAGDFEMNTSAFRIGCVLTDYTDEARDHLAPIVREAEAHGEIRSQIGAYVIAVQDAAAILADALGDPTARGLVCNTFDRWLDFASLAPQIGEILGGRQIRVACAAAPEPNPPIENARVRARFSQWTTDAQINRLLRKLALR